MDRLVYALIGAGFGALLGVAGWWLYGLGMSVRYLGPGIDADLLHWVKAGAAVFAALGFLFKDRVGGLLGGSIAGVARFEAGRTEERHLTGAQIVVALVVLAALAWYILS